MRLRHYYGHLFYYVYIEGWRHQRVLKMAIHPPWNLIGRAAPSALRFNISDRWVVTDWRPERHFIICRYRLFLVDLIDSKVSRKMSDRTRSDCYSLPLQWIAIRASISGWCPVIKTSSPTINKREKRKNDVRRVLAQQTQTHTLETLCSSRRIEAEWERNKQTSRKAFTTQWSLRNNMARFVGKPQKCVESNRGSCAPIVLPKNKRESTSIMRAFATSWSFSFSREAQKVLGFFFLYPCVFVCLRLNEWNNSTRKFHNHNTGNVH
jgi:hypothetical protein